MSRLVRLFPRRWRQRYGDEFDALLDEVPAGPAVIADVVLAASAARVRGVTDRVGSLRWADRQTALPGLAVLAGSLWATTFALGVAVGWGRNGTDWGFLLLIAAAIGLTIAQVDLGWATLDGSRFVARIGVAISAVGTAVLGVALLAAIVLERPLAVRLPWSPMAVWEAGMALFVAGTALSGLAMIRGGRSHAVCWALIAVASVPLVLALAVAGDVGASLVVESPAGGVAAASFTAGEHGWFVGDPRVAIAGMVFGLAFAVAGLDRLRTVRMTRWARSA